MNRARLAELLEAFARVKIAVLGDLFLDRWLTIDPALDESSVETGLTAWQVVEDKRNAGAAGTVLNNLATLGVGGVYAISLLGMDGAGWDMEQALAQKGVDTRWVVRSDEMLTPQYNKPLFLQKDGSKAEGNRLDVKNHRPTPESLQDRMVGFLESAAAQVDAVIVLDQLDQENMGVVTEKVRNALREMAAKRPELILYADSRAFIHKFRNVIIKCNDREALRMTTGKEPEGPFSRDAVFAAMERMARLTGKPAFITCNAYGVAVQCRDGNKLVPAARQSGPIDVCGAGDACTAGIVSALCAGAESEEAAFMGNLAAGVTVRKLGETGTVNPGEIWALYEEQFGEDAT